MDIFRAGQAYHVFLGYCITCKSVSKAVSYTHLDVYKRQALHRAVYLARANPEARVLLTTFSDTLANALKLKLKRLVNNEPRITERLEVYSLDSIGRRLYEINYGRPNIVSRKVIEDILQEYLQKDKDNKFSLHFLIAEWEEVVDAWQLETWRCV